MAAPPGGDPPHALPAGLTVFRQRSRPRGGDTGTGSRLGLAELAAQKRAEKRRDQQLSQSSSPERRVPREENRRDSANHRWGADTGESRHHRLDSANRSWGADNGESRHQRQEWRRNDQRVTSAGSGHDHGYVRRRSGSEATGETWREKNDPKMNSEVDGKEDLAFDRAFYDDEETSTLDTTHYGSMSGNADGRRGPFLSGDVDTLEERLIRRAGAGVGKSFDQERRGAARIARAQANRERYTAENDRWELSQMRSSGHGRTRGVDHAALQAEQGEERMHVVVLDKSPPFLQQKIALSKQADPVLPVRDPTSDMAKLARTGSLAVKAYREDQTRKKDGAPKFWEISATKMGQVMGLEDKDAKEALLHDVERAVNDTKSFATSLSDNRKGTGASEFSRTLSLREQRQSLPIFQCRDELLSVIREHNIVVVVGETGSGKTTQLAQYLCEAGFANTGRIGVTQPRRVAAVSVAKRVADEMDVRLGDKVGYSIRFEDVSSRSTEIKFMTEGILLRETLRSSLLDDYSVIVIDEAHERSLNADVLLGLLKGVASERSDLKVIVTSATMNAERFARFFGNTPIFTIPGRTFAVDTMFARTNSNDYVQDAVDQIVRIHLTCPAPGDMLVFLTGQEDIETCCALVQERLDQMMQDAEDEAGAAPADAEGPVTKQMQLQAEARKLAASIAPLALLPMYSQLPADLQSKIFEEAPEGTRKCVIATNIAETSLTVDGIRYVVDSGFCKLKVYNPRIGMDALQVFPVSRANADQRKGRAGRTMPGQCFRLFPEGAYWHELLENTVPEIQRTHLAHVVLLLKSLGVRSLLNFPWLDAPPQENVEQAMYQLWVLDALDNDGELTDVGKRMADFPLDPALAKLLLVARDLHCTEEAVIIVAMLSVPQVFYRPKGREDESDAIREKFFVPESDHLTLLNVYQLWIKANKAESWCAKHFIHGKALRKVKEVRDQLVDIMKPLGISLESCGTDWDVLRRVICAAYFHNAARFKSIGEYQNLRTGLACHLHPTSALFGLGFTADYVVYHELVLTSKEYMQCVTTVDAKWLGEYGPMFFAAHAVGDVAGRQAALDLAETKDPGKQRGASSNAQATSTEQGHPSKRQASKEVTEFDIGARARGPKRKRAKFDTFADDD